MAIYSEVFPLKVVIFHSYVKLPEGTWECVMGQNSVPWGLPRFDQPVVIVPSHLSLRCSSVRFRNLPRHVFTWSHPRPTPPVTAKCIEVCCRGFYIVLDGLAGLGMVLSFEYGLGWYGRLQNGWSASRTVTTSQLTKTWSMYIHVYNFWKHVV